MNKKVEDDLLLIDLPPMEDAQESEGTDPAASLFAKELATYEQFDDQDDEAYERRVRHAFLARELKQIDEIVSSRKAYADKIFDLVVWWLVALGVVVVLAGFKGKTNFDLDSKIILALIGGTTLNVLGIFTIVTNFLFPKNGHSIFSRSSTAAAKKATKKPPVRKSASAPAADD